MSQGSYRSTPDLSDASLTLSVEARARRAAYLRASELRQTYERRARHAARADMRHRASQALPELQAKEAAALAYYRELGEV